MNSIPNFLQLEETPREPSANTHEGRGNVAKQAFLHIYFTVLTKLKHLAA